MRGRAKPVTTIMAVIKRPRSTAADGSKESREKSSEAHWENNAFGRGARTNNKAGERSSISDRSARRC